MQQSRYSSTALREITDSGGHLILVRRGQKYPVWSKWENRKPTLDVALAHDGRLGLIPHSIGATALDVDYGDASNLPIPWTSYRTQRRGGVHLYYGDDEKRGNQKWQAKGCSGEVRGSKGYLILHQGGDTNIARAIRSGRQMNLFPFPADLIELHEAELVQPGPVQLHAVEDHGQASLRLEGVYPGARNESLFLVVRLWAYKQRRGSDLESWCQWVEYFTLESNLRLPVPLPEREASATAYSVATWIWSELDETNPAKGKGPLDHSSIAQAWRGTWSGESRRRETPLEQDREPWERLGISRATYYRDRSRVVPKGKHGGARWASETEPLNQEEKRDQKAERHARVLNQAIQLSGNQPTPSLIRVELGPSSSVRRRLINFALHIDGEEANTTTEGWGARGG